MWNQKEVKLANLNMKIHHTSYQLSELIVSVRFFCLDSACTMYRSFIEKKPVGMDTKSIASGLAPPFAGMIQDVFTAILHRVRLLAVLFHW